MNVVCKRLGNSRGASRRRAHPGSSGPSQSPRRPCAPSSGRPLRRARFRVGRSRARTASASVPPPRAPLPSGSARPAAATKCVWDRELVPAAARSPGARAGRARVRVPAGRVATTTGRRSDSQQAASGGGRGRRPRRTPRKPAASSAKESDFVAALADFRRLRGAGRGGASCSLRRGAARRCLKGTLRFPARLHLLLSGGRVGQLFVLHVPTLHP